MPQAIKRFYGSFTGSTYTTVYTCPSSTIAKVIVNGLTLSSGAWAVHTSTSSSNTYYILGCATNESNLHFVGLGDRLLMSDGNRNYMQSWPLTQVSVGQAGHVYFKEFNEGFTEYTNGSNTLKPSYKNEWYLSPGQKLFFYSTNNNFTNGYDFLIIEEAGS